jgi:hypothetical protein
VGGVRIEEGANPKLTANDIIPLDEARVPLPKALRIRIPLESATDGTVDALHALFNERKGEAKVLFDVERDGDFMVVMEAEGYNVMPDRNFLAEWKSCAGAAACASSVSASHVAAALRRIAAGRGRPALHVRPMRRAKIKRAEKIVVRQSAGNGSNSGAEPCHIAGAGMEFLLSFVEAHHTRKNGNVIKMDSGLKAQQELARIEEQITRLQAREGQKAETIREMQQLHDRVNDLRREISSHLNAWERTELARHPQRPYTLDYIERIFTDWSEIHGDRGFRDDPAIVCGMARFHGEEVMVVGQQKARDAKQRVYRNFGMPHPEGYRKALRVMKIAEKFKRPIFTFVDTDGAYPGLHAEERGQGEAIARNLLEMARLEVPIVTTVIGVGGSGGALAIAVADRVLMMEKFGLLRDFAGGLRVDHVARCQQERSGGGSYEDHGQGFERTWLH